MEEKDTTIERKLKSQLKRVESGEPDPVIVEEDQYEVPKLKQVKRTTMIFLFINGALEIEIVLGQRSMKWPLIKYKQLYS